MENDKQNKVEAPYQERIGTLKEKENYLYWGKLEVDMK